MLCTSPAKINLGLHVLSRRGDGFHNIETVMYPVRWNDVLEALPGGASTTVNLYRAEEIFPQEENLVYKAWVLMNKRFGIAPVAFHLMKNIPTKAGLGGGSGNAVAALRLLSDFFQLGVDDETLSSMAMELGSDCRFFVRSQPALLRSKGESVTPVNLSLKGYSVVIVKPRMLKDGSQGISTREAYSLIKPNSRRDPVETLISYPVNEWCGLLYNDFQPIICARYPEIAELIMKLYDLGAVYAAMSGSGSACFGLFEKKNPELSFSRDFIVHRSQML